MWLNAGTPVASDAIRGVGCGGAAWGDPPGADAPASPDGAGAPLAWGAGAGAVLAAATGGVLVPARVAVVARDCPAPVGAPAGDCPDVAPRRPSRLSATRATIATAARIRVARRRAGGGAGRGSTKPCYPDDERVPFAPWTSAAGSVTSRSRSWSRRPRCS